MAGNSAARLAGGTDLCWPAAGKALQQMAKHEHANGNDEKAQHLAKRDLLTELGKDREKRNREASNLQ